MNNLNVSILEGNLVNPPELKTVGADLKICEFSIANNQGFGDKQHVNYFDVKVFGKNAENCVKYLVKGQSVKIVGTLKQDRWKSPDGSIRSRVVIDATQVIFGFKKDGQSSQTNNSDYPTESGIVNSDEENDSVF